MATIGILSWQNETSLSAYPLVKECGLNSLLIDANFVQFDNFIPTLVSISLLDQNFSVTLQIDNGPLILVVNVSEFIGSPLTKRLYDSAGRYVGTLVFGANALAVFTDQNNQNLTINMPFLSFLVKSIPSNCGVYSLAGKYGAVAISGDQNLWFSYAAPNNSITFNAAALANVLDLPYLKTLNGIGPSNNNVYMQETDLLKIVGSGSATIQFSLIGADISNLLMKNSNIIVKNLTPSA